MGKIQIGIIAYRNPDTGEFYPSRPIYAIKDEKLERAEERMTREIIEELSIQMKPYFDALEAGA